MADTEPSSQKRERILQALDRAKNEKGLEKGGRVEKGTGKTAEGEGWAGEVGERTGKERLLHCLHVNETVLENKLVYFMLRAGSAGATPFLSAYGLRWALPRWMAGLMAGAGLLAAAILVPIWGLLADRFRWHRGMFWAVILLWMGFTVATVYYPQAEAGPCDVATDQLLDALSIGCEDGRPVPLPDPLSASRPAVAAGPGRGLLMDATGRRPLPLQTWPDPCTVDPAEVCAVYDAMNMTGTGWLAVPDSNATQAPFQGGEEEEEDLTTAVPPDLGLRATHQGWMLDKAGQERTSLVVFILAAVAGVLQISAFSLADTSTLMVLGEAHRDRYGWQRSFGSLGYALASLLVMVILYRSTTTATFCGITWEDTDYDVGVVVYAGFMTVGVLVSSCVGFQHSDMSSLHDLGSVRDVVFSWTYGSVFVTAFFLSFCNGALTTFLTWHLHELGATSSLLAGALCAHALADFVASFLTAYLVRRTGYHFPILLGLVGYCLVYLCYAFVSRPGWIVPIEIVHGASFAISLNALTSYLASSMALVSQASVQGLLSGVYWGLGPAAGTALFGYLSDTISPTLSFYILALVMLLYSTIFLIWSRHELPMIDKYLNSEYQPVRTGSED